MRKIMCSLLAALGVVTAAGATEPQGLLDALLLYPKDAHPFDKSVQGWGERSVQWLYAQPFDHNPFFDQTGADCGVGQTGPVWFIAPIASMAPGNFARSCTVPRGKAILLQAMFVSDTYPCPDPNFQPPAGVSLYDFLVADSKTYLMMSSLEISLDGYKIHNPMDYAYISENLLSIKGDPSLVSTFDPCITTNWQPAVINATFLMFRPLLPGHHTLVRKSTSTMGVTNTFTYYLTVQ